MALFGKRDEDGERRPSVLGSRLGEVSGRIRRMPKGGIREEGPTMDAATISGAPRASANGGRGSKAIRVVIIVAAVAAVLLVAGVIAVSVLARTSAFTIDSIDAQDTEHLTAENIARLAKVEKGATLLNIDTATVEENLKKNPWVASARITREFPDRLRIEVTERKVGYLVVMATGNVVWYLGEDDVWIEPVRLDVPDNLTVADVALTSARQMGAVLITDVPPSVSPVAGSRSTDESIQAVESFQEQFSQDFRSQIASYSVSSTDSVSCVLDSGVEVSLGSPSNVSSKEAVITSVVAQYPGQITYINVRVPSKPAYRRLDSDDVQSGTGAAGTSVDDGSQFTDNVPVSTQLSEEGEYADSDGADTTTDTDESTDDASGSSATQDDGSASSASGDADGSSQDGSTSSE